MSHLAKSAAVPVGSYVGIAVLTAFIASILGPLLFNLYIAFASPGDGGPAAAIMAVVPFTFAGLLIAFPVGVVALLLIGIPLARRFTGAIRTRPFIALLAGSFAGGVVGALAGALLFGLSDAIFFPASPISGAVFGFLWIFAVRLILHVPKPSSDV